MSKKPLSKKELKARKAEKNKEKRKKIDYRAWANKYFKHPTDHLPLKMSGMGAGKTSYCYDCNSVIPKTTFKEGITKCDTCGGIFVELREKNPSWWKRFYWEWKQIQYEYKKCICIGTKERN